MKWEVYVYFGDMRKEFREINRLAAIMKRQVLKALFILLTIKTWGQTYEITAYHPDTAKYSKKVTDENYSFMFTPPGVIKITPKFFCDQQELGNVHWREYMFWTKQIYGENSMEYLATLPDSTVWLKEDSCLSSYVNNYLKHPAYDLFPLVGVTQQQAAAYSKWRSDRVFEGLLVQLNKIEWDSAQSSNNYFTIEKYFNDTASINYRAEKVKYYPNYRLPTLADRQQILHYADSVDNAYFNKCRSKYCRERKANFPGFYSDVKFCDTSKLSSGPTISTYEHYSAEKGYPIYNLRGNVSEWATEDSISFGGGWINSRERILLSDSFQVAVPNAWTGFCNVCVWKRWKE